MMSSAACLSLQVGRLLRPLSVSGFQARRFDCSFVLAFPVQTSMEARLQRRRGLRSTVSRRRCPSPWARSALPSGILTDAVLPLRCLARLAQIQFMLMRSRSRLDGSHYHWTGQPMQSEPACCPWPQRPHFSALWRQGHLAKLRSAHGHA
jgi:hypothetical protein